MHYENAILGISVISFPEIWLADGVIHDVRINNPIQYNTKYPPSHAARDSKTQQIVTSRKEVTEYI